jgi:signal transduction histidine kinase
MPVTPSPGTLSLGCDLLTSSLEPPETIANIARTATETGLADYCVVDVRMPTGRVSRLEVAQRVPEEAEVARALRDAPIDPSRWPASRLVESGESVLEPSLTAAALEKRVQDLAQVALLRGLRIHSYIGVPLSGVNDTLGAITLLRKYDRRPYDEGDLQLASELGRRAGLALDHARMYDAARRAARARDEALGVAAHDLRSPLNSIVMATTLIQQRLPEDGDPVVRKALDGILRESDRMNRLIQDLLDVAHLEAGTLSIIHGAADPRALGREAVIRIEPIAKAKGVDVECVVSRGLPRVDADAERVLQVFSNLLDNAVRHTPRRGRVTISASAGTDNVTFCVADTGEGIEPERLRRLFDRFAPHRSTDRRGTGFGLPIVAAIVHAHGGRVWAESTPAQGSRFLFTLPIARMHTNV